MELHQGTGDTSRTFVAITQLLDYYTNRAEHTKAINLAEQLVHLSRSSQDSHQKIAAFIALGYSSICLGEFSQARLSLDQAIAAYDPQEHRSSALLWGADYQASALCHQALNLWYLGFPSQALRRGEEAVDWARELKYPFSLGLVLAWLGALHWERRDSCALRGCSEELLRLSTEAGLSPLQAIAKVHQGWVQAQQGEVEEGTNQTREGITQWRSLGMVSWVPFFLSGLAEVYGAAGKAEEGLSLLEEAIALVEETEGRCHESRVRLVKGDLLRLIGRTSEADACLRQAIEVARHQKAKSWELRATLSLSRLLQNQGRCEEARAMLSQIYEWFTEGFDTRDLQEARALLKELGG